jgi:beta-phosphoglucomutase-like phosphatase (HAD superfamily)
LNAIEAAIEAVVFDCDGTLADSEPLSVRAWQAVLARYGHTLTAADYERMVGLTYAEAHAIVAQRAQPLPNADALWIELTDVLFPLIATDLRPFEDAVSTVELLAGLGVPIAIASSSPRPRLDRTLAALGLSAAFAITVAGDEVAQGKPAPDLFLAAAAGLRVAPEHCLAIEDSVVGVASAKAAGMRTIAVSRDGRAASLAAADLIVERLDPALVASEVGRVPA